MAAIFRSVLGHTTRLELQVHSTRFLWSSGLVAKEGWRERYLEMSKLSTQYFQPSLPRLPIPSLELTLSRYLAAQKPLVTSGDHQRIKKLTEEFIMKSSAGWKVHQQLLEQDRNNPHTSYIAKLWLDRYLEDRRPLALHNAYLGLKRDPSGPSQVCRAVNLIHSAVRLWNSVTDSQLQPDLLYKGALRISPQSLETVIRFVPQRLATQVASLAGVVPIDMSQYSRLFGTTRIPKCKQDELMVSPSSQHVVVMRNGHLYAVEVQQANGLPVHPDQLHTTLSAIVNDCLPAPLHAVSYLTGIDRDTWADVRRELIADSQNAHALEKVESALFIVCLDNNEPQTVLDSTHAFLHNHGANRWFDKSIQLVVSAKADVGIVFEHSWGDSHTVLSFMNKVFFDTIHHPFTPTTGITNTPVFERLQFSLTESVMDAVMKARVQVEEKCRSFSMHIIETYGKHVFKSKDVSPNSTLQLAFQMANYNQYGHFHPTILPCSTATFLHGRTEWVRPGTMASKACAQAFKPTSGASTAEKWRLLKEATTQISRLAREANMGLGFDRHLYALKCVAEKEGFFLALFEDEAYARINQPILYPSTIKAEAISSVAFGPLCSDGIGIGYIMEEEAVYISVSAYSAERLDTFTSNLKIVLQDIYNVMMKI